MRIVAPSLTSVYFVRMRLRYIFISLLLFVCVAVASAQSTIEPIGAVKVHVPDPVKAAISDAGYRVTVDGNVLAEIWMAKSAATEKNGSTAALYPDFATGAFYGVVSFPNGAGDFRGQKIPAGTYSLRYQLLPGDGNHLGVAPNPDFFLLVPVDVDTNPGDKIPYPALVKLSAKASGTAHPAAFSLDAPGEKSPGASVDPSGHVIATVPLKLASKDIKVGIILKGSAEQ
jgi:hypothetical protein